MSRHPADTPTEVCYSWALRVERACGLTVVHPCKVKSFGEAESAVMDNLDRMLANKIIDNLHLMILINLTSKLDLLSQ